jgi:Cys-tRNA(Pro)/Cys-tRNA(Cys) deacylase
MAKDKPVKLNSTRLLDANKVPYTVTAYDNSGDFHNAVEVAEMLGETSETVYKTLVVLREPNEGHKPLLVMIQSNSELDLKLLAKSIGEKSLRMATQKEAEALTRLQVGGIGALALLNRGFDVILDRNALNLAEVNVSAGQRGVNIKLPVADLIHLTKAQTAVAVECESRMY